MHLLNISQSCYLLAKTLGFSKNEAETVKNASMLHDIGKVAIPDHILLKTGKLSDEEYNKMKTHTFYGGKILEGAKSKILQVAHKMSLFHHENYDGTGYPFGLKGSKIPIEARILSVADVFDALCMKRIYKKAWKISEAYKYMIEHSGSEFDPEVIEAFKHVFHEIKTPYIKKAYF
jgi:HD-GYP domain-containing protein (c-di-GMP phosphodiesterase class II)